MIDHHQVGRQAKKLALEPQGGLVRGESRRRRVDNANRGPEPPLKPFLQQARPGVSALGIAVERGRAAQNEDADLPRPLPRGNRPPPEPLSVDPDDLQRANVFPLGHLPPETRVGPIAENRRPPTRKILVPKKQPSAPPSPRRKAATKARTIARALFKTLTSVCRPAGLPRAFGIQRSKRCAGLERREGSNAAFRGLPEGFLGEQSGEKGAGGRKRGGGRSLSRSGRARRPWNKSPPGGP